MKNRWVDTLPENEEKVKLEKLVGPNQLGKIINPITSTTPPLFSEDDFHKLTQKYGNFYGNKVRDGSVKRASESKDLFKLTLNSMRQLPTLREDSKFQGIKYKNPPGNITGREAMGMFRPQDNTTYLSPNIPQGIDIVPLIDHETQHAIEHHYPKVQNTTANFLKNRFYNAETGNSKIPENYIPSMYQKLQHAINFPAEFTQAYNAYDIPENKEKGQNEQRSILDVIQHQDNTLRPITAQSSINDKTLPYRLTHRFDEVPAFSVQALSNPDHPWQINEMDRDSTVLMHDIIRDTRNQYRNLGLDDQDEKDEYKYQGARQQFNGIINQLANREQEFSNNDIRPRKYRKLNDDSGFRVPRRTEAEGYYAKGGQVQFKSPTLTPEEARIAEVFNMSPEEYKRLQLARFPDMR